MFNSFPFNFQMFNALQPSVFSELGETTDIFAISANDSLVVQQQATIELLIIE